MLMTLIGLCFAVVVVSLLAKRLFGKKKKVAQVVERSEIDTWIEEALARALGKKLEQGEETVLGSLRGDPDPDVVSAVERAVREVKVSYERLPANLEFEVVAKITFEDGTSATGRTRFAREKLPRAVSEEFTRTGGAFVFKDWHFPWSGPDRGWSI
jgi:hypothetical protein